MDFYFVATRIYPFFHYVSVISGFMSLYLFHVSTICERDYANLVLLASIIIQGKESDHQPQCHSICLDTLFVP